MNQVAEHDRRIVVGVDGSPGSRTALRWAITQAGLTGARVEAVERVAGPATYGFAYGWPPAVFEDVSIAAVTENIVAEAVADEAAGGAPVQILTRVLHGHPAQVLLDTAGGTQLLVVGQPRTPRLRRDAARFGQPALRPRVMPGGGRAAGGADARAGQEAIMIRMTTSAGRGEFPARPPAEQVSLGSYPTYAEAQQVVDCLADHHFEVGTTQIIGSDLRLVEQITGAADLAAGAVVRGPERCLVWRLCRAAPRRSERHRVPPGHGAGSRLGCAVRMAFAAAGYALTGGRRDFTSRSATVPSRFEVLVAAGYGDWARAVLEGAAR